MNQIESLKTVYLQLKQEKESIKKEWTIFPTDYLNYLQNLYQKLEIIDLKGCKIKHFVRFNSYLSRLVNNVGREFSTIQQFEIKIKEWAVQKAAAQFLHQRYRLLKIAEKNTHQSAKSFYKKICQNQVEILGVNTGENTVIWEIWKNGKEKSYLYPSLHLLPENSNILPPTLLTALERCDLLALEFVTFDEKKLKRVGQKGGLEDVIKKNFAKKQLKKLIELSEQVVDPELVEINAKNTKLVNETNKYRMTYPHEIKPLFLRPGVEFNLGEIALKNKIKIVSLEEEEDHLLFCAQLLRDQNLQPLKIYPSGYLSSEEGVFLSIDAWQQGSLKNVRKALKINPIDMESVKKRNRQMVVRLVQLLEKQRVFTSIGLYHFIGKENLIELLKKEGYQARPLKAKDLTF